MISLRTGVPLVFWLLAAAMAGLALLLPAPFWTEGNVGWTLLYLAAPPFLAFLLWARPDFERPVLAVLAFTTCHIHKPLYMEVMFRNYRGTDRGYGVTPTDLLVAGLLLWLLATGRDRRSRIWLPWNTVPYLGLAVVACISVCQSPVPDLGFFTLYKLLRGFLLYWVVVNCVRSRKEVKAVLAGLLATLIFQGWVVFYDKWITGAVVYRVVGTFPHPNSLAMYVNMVLPLALALLLVGGRLRLRDLFLVSLVAGGLILVVFTRSRAAMVLAAGVVLFQPIYQFFLGPSRRIVILVGCGLFVLAALGAALGPSIQRRFRSAPDQSALTRIYFNDAARAMARDHTFGVGLNAYSWTVANTEYYWLVYPDKADVPDRLAFRQSEAGHRRLGTAHNIYYLWAAEIGWWGLGFWLLWAGRFLLRNLVEIRRNRHPADRALLLGLLLAAVTFHMQGWLEWVGRQTQVFYLFLLLAGLLVALGRIRREGQAPAPALPT